MMASIPPKPPPSCPRRRRVDLTAGFLQEELLFRLQGLTPFFSIASRSARSSKRLHRVRSTLTSPLTTFKSARTAMGPLSFFGGSQLAGSSFFFSKTATKNPPVSS